MSNAQEWIVNNCIDHCSLLHTLLAALVEHEWIKIYQWVPLSNTNVQMCFCLLCAQCCFCSFLCLNSVTCLLEGTPEEHDCEWKRLPTKHIGNLPTELSGVGVTMLFWDVNVQWKTLVGFIHGQHKQNFCANNINSQQQHIVSYSENLEIGRKVVQMINSARSGKWCLQQFSMRACARVCNALICLWFGYAWSVLMRDSHGHDSFTEDALLSA